MKTAIRLDEQLIREAQLEGHFCKRSTPNQLEYWIEIGKQVSALLSPNELLSITQGFAQLRIEEKVSNPIDPEEVFATVDKDRTQEKLQNLVTKSTPYYEASIVKAGLIDQVDKHGHRVTGHFKDGQFIPVKTAK